MKIINQTKGVILAEKAILADSLLKRMKGLLGKTGMEKSQALILNPCNSVHTFFMRFPIDVLFLDKNNTVIEVILGLRAFRITRIYFNAALAIEFPSGTLSSLPLSKGDNILLT